MNYRVVPIKAGRNNLAKKRYLAKAEHLKDPGSVLF